jgi:hypothetical protein
MKHATSIAAAALACVSALASEAACRAPEPASGSPPAAAVGASERHTAVENGAGSRVIGKEAEGEELLALAGDRLLLWSVQGRARSRSANGEWSELALPLVAVRDVRAKGDGVLVVGQDPTTRVQAVSWVSAEGKELGRWALPKEAGFGASVDAAAMQITIGTTVSQLEPGGTLRLLRSLPEDVHQPGLGGPRRVELAGSSIVCHGADLSMAHGAPGHCRRSGTSGWEFEGPFVEPPLECGSWLVVSSSADGKALEARDQGSGQPQGRARLPTPPLLACAGPDAVVIGTQDVAARRLPSLEVIWHHPVGKNTVRQLAVTDNFVAYVVSGSWDVHLVAKPVARAR